MEESFHDFTEDNDDEKLEIELNIDDRIQVEKFKNFFESKTSEELILFYETKQNDLLPLNIKLYRLCALKEILRERFGDKPFNYNGQTFQF